MPEPLLGGAVADRGVQSVACEDVAFVGEARKRGAEVGPDGHPLRPGRKCCVCGKEIDPRKNERTMCCSDVCSMRRSNRLSRGAPVGEEEYRKYQQKTLTPVEEAYLQSIRAAEKEVKTEQKKGKNNA